MDVKREQVPEAWDGYRVKAKLRTEGKAGYWILGRLRATSDKGTKLCRKFVPALFLFYKH